MQQSNEAEDELSRQLSAWEAEGDLQRALWSDAGDALGGGLSYDASARGTPISIGGHACHSAAPLQNPTVVGHSEDLYQTLDSNADVYAAFSEWPQKQSHYEDLATAREEAGVFITKDVAEEEQANNTPPAEGKADPAYDRDSVAAAGDAAKGIAATGSRLGLGQGMRRLLDRASTTRSAMRRGVRRVREIVGIAYRHARHNSPLTGRDEVCEPLLEDDAFTGEEDAGRRSLKEFLEADKKLFR